MSSTAFKTVKVRYRTTYLAEVSVFSIAIARDYYSDLAQVLTAESAGTPHQITIQIPLRSVGFEPRASTRQQCSKCHADCSVSMINTNNVNFVSHYGSVFIARGRLYTKILLVTSYMYLL